MRPQRELRIWKRVGGVALILVALSGCARRYVITLSNGAQIGTKGKPHAKGGYYVYKDPTGAQSYISAGRVSQIAPASMVEQPTSKFTAKPSK